MSRYNEIFRLKEMLEKDGVEFEFHDRALKSLPHLDTEKYQIIVMDDNNERLVSVIEGWGTYGSEADKLEIMGLLTDEEEEHDGVAGWLTADDVFDRIRNAVH